MHTETKVEMGRTCSKNEGQQADQTLHRVTTKEREEIKRTNKQKIARRHNKKGGKHLEHEKKKQNKQTNKKKKKTTPDRGQWKTLMEGYILQWINKA